MGFVQYNQHVLISGFKYCTATFNNNYITVCQINLLPSSGIYHLKLNVWWTEFLWKVKLINHQLLK